MTPEAAVVVSSYGSLDYIYSASSPSMMLVPMVFRPQHVLLQTDSQQHFKRNSQQHWGDAKYFYIAR
jgi:hypothetical protein